MHAIESQLWKLTRKRVFDLYGTNCYTCNQTLLVGANLQCGHAYPKGALGASLRYDVRVLRPQCFNDNINLGGMSVVFWKNLEKEMGKEEADALYEECRLSKGRPIKARDHYLKLIQEYSL